MLILQRIAPKDTLQLCTLWFSWQRAQWCPRP